MLSGKLVPPQSKDYKKCELFIVEGDSAGGSAKKCRDKRYQGLLPLRGKPKNVSADAEDLCRVRLSQGGSGEPGT